LIALQPEGHQPAVVARVDHGVTRVVFAVQTLEEEYGIQAGKVLGQRHGLCVERLTPHPL